MPHLLENYRAVSLTPVSGKITKLVFLEATHKHIKDENLIWNSPHIFAAG